MERTTANGVEQSADGGVTWVLVTPSEAFLAARAAAVAAAEQAGAQSDPLTTLLAALADAQTLPEVREAALAAQEAIG